MYKSDPDPVQNGAVYMSENINSKKNLNSKNNTNEDPKDAKQIVTGTVITDCIIQTSGLPHRVLIQDNDITFFDDTNVVDGKFIGDTSRLIFQSAGQLDPNNPRGAFVMEKRVSINDPLDSVLSWYSTSPIPGHHNWLFIGRNGSNLDPQRNLNAMYLAVNIVTADAAGPGNGVWGLEIDTNGAVADVFAIIAGDSRSIAGPAFNGFSAAISAGGGGVVGLGYQSGSNLALLWYLLNATTVSMGANVLPDANAAYDLGSPSFKLKNIYGNVIACPLPTVENALDIIRRIPEPTKVGDRGHFGDRLYFDDLTFPEEVLLETEHKMEIEHTMMIGLLMKAVTELTAKVDILEAKLGK